MRVSSFSCFQISKKNLTGSSRVGLTRERTLIAIRGGTPISANLAVRRPKRELPQIWLHRIGHTTARAGIDAAPPDTMSERRGSPVNGRSAVVIEPAG